MPHLVMPPRERFGPLLCSLETRQLQLKGPGAIIIQWLSVACETLTPLGKMPLERGEIVGELPDEIRLLTSLRRGGNGDRILVNIETDG